MGSFSCEINDGGGDLGQPEAPAGLEPMGACHKVVSGDGDVVLDHRLFTNRDRVQQPDLLDAVDQHRDLILAKVAQPVAEADPTKGNSCEGHLAHDATPSAVTSSASMVSMAAMAVWTLADRLRKPGLTTRSWHDHPAQSSQQRAALEHQQVVPIEQSGSVMSDLPAA
jgi:hypothetical protein